jgi:hypothetical protein
MKDYVPPKEEETTIDWTESRTEKGNLHSPRIPSDWYSQSQTGDTGQISTGASLGVLDDPAFIDEVVNTIAETAAQMGLNEEVMLDELGMGEGSPLIAGESSTEENKPQTDSNQPTAESTTPPVTLTYEQVDILKDELEKLGLDVDVAMEELGLGEGTAASTSSTTTQTTGEGGEDDTKGGKVARPALPEEPRPPETPEDMVDLLETVESEEDLAQWRETLSIMNLRPEVIHGLEYMAEKKEKEFTFAEKETRLFIPDEIAVLGTVNRETIPYEDKELILQDYLVSLIIPGSGDNSQWTAEDWEYYDSLDPKGKKDKLVSHRLWNGGIQWSEDDPASFERFTDHVVRFASNFDNKEEFIRAFALVWGGVPYYPSWPIAAWSVKGGPELRTLDEGEEGFAEKYHDTGQITDNNPAHHYAGLFFLGYYDPSGSILSKIASLPREVEFEKSEEFFQPWTNTYPLVNKDWKYKDDRNPRADDFMFFNKGDWRLGELAIRHGIQFREFVPDENTTIAEFMAELLSELSEEYEE